MRRWLARLRCALTGHDYDEDRIFRRSFVDGGPTGFVVLGWDLLPHRELQRTERCLRCGLLRTTRGLHVSGRESVCDESGWPIDAAGRRLPIRP
jgi:hypothetical protein